MALYMMFYVAPDSHLEFLRDNPTLFDSYLGGEMPDLSQGLLAKLLGKQPPELPHDWPGHELEVYSPEINHRQVNLFHYLLNGTDELVENVGCVFQTWFKPRHNSPTVVIDGENFALLSTDVRQLLHLVEGLTAETMRDRLDDSDKASAVQDSIDVVEFGFEVIGKACAEAVSKGQGLVWSNR